MKETPSRTVEFPINTPLTRVALVHALQCATSRVLTNYEVPEEAAVIAETFSNGNKKPKVTFSMQVQENMSEALISTINSMPEGRVRIYTEKFGPDADKIFINTLIGNLTVSSVSNVNNA